MNEQVFLKKYDVCKYPKPSVTADISIFSIFDEGRKNYRKLPDKKLKVLLVKRGRPPFEGMYALPGGFLREHETLEQTAYRELLEETGVECNFLEQLKTYSTIGRDPRGWIITCAFMALIDGASIQVYGGDDATSAEWFQISFRETGCSENGIVWELVLEKDNIRLTALVQQADDAKYQAECPHFTVLEQNGLAFDHALLLADAICSLRRLIGRTNIAFELLPPMFTLSDLQQVYETVLDRKLLTPSFRRKIVELVEETDQFQETVGHRPSKLFMARCR